MRHCTIIGISDSREQWFKPEVEAVIKNGKVFSGGKRHHEIMAEFLPEGAVWIDITVPLAGVFETYKQHDELVIFASGDPLFYGFASTVMRECPDCAVTVYPTFNSLQLLAHRLHLPYQEMCVTSLTGRPWDQFDTALIEGKSLIGTLTDKHKTPQVIWEHMKTYGYTNYQIFVGEKLGNEKEERVSAFAEGESYSDPNCLILKKTAERPRHFGIPDSEFHLLNGRAKMITKMPIRLCSLSALELSNKRSFWDVGFCTGSISIEANLQFPNLHINAFEIREEGQDLMRKNSQKFGAPGIAIHIGDFLKFDLREMEAPDAVFIGGHGGQLKEMVARIKQVLLPGGCIVFNSVSAESQQLFKEATTENGLTCQEWHTITVDANNPITILKAQ